MGPARTETGGDERHAAPPGGGAVKDRLGEALGGPSEEAKDRLGEPLAQPSVGAAKDRLGEALGEPGEAAKDGLGQGPAAPTAARSVADRVRGPSPTGPIRTPRPWDGKPYGAEGADWARLNRLDPYIESACRECGVDPLLIKAMIVVETQGVWIVRDEDRWDREPAVGYMQVKPAYHRWRLPDADPYTEEGNIRLGAKVMADAIRDHGTWQAALTKVYFPAPDEPRGTDQNAYVRTVAALMEEMRSFGPGVGGETGPVGPTGADLVAEARRHLGKPYAWATAGPDAFDCSGLVYYCYNRVTGETLDPSYRDSHQQFLWGEAVDPRAARPGDLVFYDTADGGEVRLGNNASHVGVYAGGNDLINALNPGRGVVVSDISTEYWARRWIGTRRVLPPG